jgi:hypothetical protein
MRRTRVERDLDVGQVVVGGDDERPRVVKAGGDQRLLLPGVHEQHRDLELLHPLQELRAVVLLDDHDLQVPLEQPLEDAVADVAKAAEDDVVAVGGGEHPGPLL